MAISLAILYNQQSACKYLAIMHEATAYSLLFQQMLCANVRPGIDDLQFIVSAFSNKHVDGISFFIFHY